ncbi:MAG: NUDIX hydrolase [Thermoproteus sp.]
MLVNQRRDEMSCSSSEPHALGAGYRSLRGQFFKQARGRKYGWPQRPRNRRPPHVVASHLFLTDGGKILFLKRRNTGYFDGFYSVPAGHVEEGETAAQAMIREAREELGITLRALEFAYVMHRFEGHYRVDFFFKALDYEGVPVNAEPEKAEHLAYFRPDSLPDNVVPYVRKAVIEHFLYGKTYGEFFL